MESNEKQIKYANILDIIDGMKQDVVNTSMQQLLMTGAMPEIAQNELKVLSQITGAVFNGIISLGTEVFEDENNGGLVYTKINGKKYSCARINISNSVSITSKPLSASEAYSMTTSTVENVSEEAQVETAKKVSIEEFGESVDQTPTNVEPTPIVEEPQIVPNVVEAPIETNEKPIEESNDSQVELSDVNSQSSYNNEPNYSFTPSAMDEANEFKDEDNNENFEQPSISEVEEASQNVVSEPQPTSVPSNESIDDLLSDDDFGNVSSTPIVAPQTPEVVEEQVEPKIPTPVEVKPTPEKTKVKTFTRNDIWEEESSKRADTMIYNMSKLMVSHIGSGRPEEIIVMIAPLKVSRVSAPAVPIVVTLYNRGKVVTKSSYDMGEGGKSIVTLEINEFYFLCRGSFDEEGKFKAFITTTGPSSQQGDKINVVSSKNYGNSHDPETKNGHIKMKYASESGEGTIEVFPFGTSDDSEFIIMVKNPEFCDTYYINQNGRTGTSAIIYGADNKLEIVPNWNGDILEVEVFEK